MRLLIGIDDTDNKESRGTGFKSRQLANLLEESGLGKVSGITRHQLFVHRDIAYTSQNSSACIDLETDNINEVKLFCAQFLIREAAEGSDAGLCVAEWKKVSTKVESWGGRAKKEVLTLDGAIALAASQSIYLEGFTGTLIGQIGALAAVGLRKNGNDGRFIWLKHKKELRELSAGFFPPETLKEDFGVQQFLSTNGEINPVDEEVFIHEWFRPVLKNHIVTLIIEKQFENGKYFWKIADKDYIRANS